MSDDQKQDEAPKMPDPGKADEAPKVDLVSLVKLGENGSQTSTQQMKEPKGSIPKSGDRK